MSANTRIQWIHKKIVDGAFPNANRLAERFAISHRQAQRDMDYLKNRLHAPLAYDPNKKGFYYTESFSLPLLADANDDLFVDENGNATTEEAFDKDTSIVQLQMPYTARIRLQDKLAATELSAYIVERVSPQEYACEFHSVGRFISALITYCPMARVVEPEWLRLQLLAVAEKAVKANQNENQPDTANNV